MPLPRDYGLEQHAPSSESGLSAPLQADIVFVHGINGDPSRTWVYTGKDGSYNWVADHGFLPSMLPFCRIFTFRWNASILHYNSDADIKNIASNLLSHISSKRVTHEERHRRLLFVCHSLGGLVVQRALTLSPDIPGRKLIMDSTTGIVFLGTPHGGSNLAKVFARLSFFIDTPKTLLDVLTVGSDSLLKVTNKFKRYYEERRSDPARLDLEIASYCEMQGTQALRIFSAQVVPIKYARLGLPQEIVREVHKDHRSIARFNRNNDQVFTMIWQDLQTFLDKPAPQRPLEPSHVRAQIYDVPYATENFVGQHFYLSKVQHFLHGGDVDTHKSLALWGDAGIGKTELAMRYAAIHQAEYKTIKLFNASSEKVLKGSMEGFFDHLITIEDPHLGRMSGLDKTKKSESVLRWLQEEKDWLIIYDNLDLDLFPKTEFRKYFPRNCSGHRMIIGRSGEIAALAKHFIEIREMSKDDAIEMLIKSARFTDLGHVNLDEATLVVEELGKIPCFIETGASYLHGYQTGLLPLLQRIRDQKDNMRIRSPQLLLGNAFAMWDIAHDKIKARPASFALMKLFSFLEGFDICSVLLQRAGRARSCWGEDGNKKKRSPEESGIDPELIRLLHDDAAFDDALKPLLDVSFVHRRRTLSNTRIEVRPLVQQYILRRMTDNERLHWTRQAVRIVSHSFPEDKCLEENYELLRSILTPHVFRCLDKAQQYTEYGFGDLDDVHDQLCSMLLSALGGSGKERFLLDYTDSLLKHKSTVYHRCLAAKWRAYVRFSHDQAAEAERLLATAQYDEQNRAKNTPSMTTPKDNAGVGDIVLHRAQCLFDQRNYVRAKEVLESWRPTSESKLETRTRRNINTGIGRSLLFLNEYEQAITALELIMADADVSLPLKELDEFNWVTVTLGQLYCKSGRFDEALALVEARIVRLLKENMRYEFITSDFRIILCEAQLRKGNTSILSEELELLLQDLQHPSQINNPRAPTQLLVAKRLQARSQYHRALQSARLMPQALDSWKTVLKHLNVDDDKILSRSFERTYDAAVAIYSVALIYLHLGDRKRALQYESIIREDQKSFEHPNAEIDYSEWLTRVQEDFKLLTNHSRRRFVLFPGRKSLAAPVKAVVLKAETCEVGESKEIDFTEKGSLCAGTRHRGDCAECRCDLLNPVL